MSKSIALRIVGALILLYLLFALLTLPGTSTTGVKRVDSTPVSER